MYSKQHMVSYFGFCLGIVIVFCVVIFEQERTIMIKPRYFVKALALYKVFRTYQLNRKDLDKADSLSAHLKAHGEDFKLMVSMAKDTLTGKHKMNKWNMSIIVGTIVYVVSPLDAVPDIIPVLGWLDDVAIVSYALSKLQKEMERYKKEQQLQPAKI